MTSDRAADVLETMAYHGSDVQVRENNNYQSKFILKQNTQPEFCKVLGPLMAQLTAERG